MSVVFGGHPIVETQSQCLLESFSIWTPSLTRIFHPPVSANRVTWSPSTWGKSFFSSICAAVICLSVSQSPVSISFLSSAVRNNSGSHFPSSALSSSDEITTAFPVLPLFFFTSGWLASPEGCVLWFFPLFVWGWLLTPSSEDSDSSLVLPYFFRLFVWGCSLSLSSSDSQWLLHLLPPWHLEEQVAPFFWHTQRWVVHPVLQLQQLDWKSFWGLSRWAASRKESTRSSCQPFTISSRSPWNGSRSPSRSKPSGHHADICKKQELGQVDIKNRRTKI